jgi:alcohol dehydrogenase
MNEFQMWIPSRTFFGVGAVKNVKEQAGQLGKRALLCAARDSMRKTGALDRVVALLKEAKIDAVVKDDVDPNPTTIAINESAAVFVKEKCDFTVGLGGGSSMDTAKSVALLAANGGKIQDYLVGGPHDDMEGLKDAYPIMCITTTAGTGSEVTPWFVITNPETKEKPGTGNDSTMAKISIVDPELMITMPRKVTASTGVDVLFHAMEAYIATCATPFTDLLALRAMELVVQYLKRAMEKGDDLEARSKMAWANTLAGVAIGEGTSSTVAIHAMGHSIGGHTNQAHGMTMAALGPAYLRNTWDACPKRYADLTRIFGIYDSDMSERELAEKSADALVALLDKFECRVSMSDLGVKPEMIDKMIQGTYHAMAYPLSVSLKKLSEEDVRRIYEESL